MDRSPRKALNFGLLEIAEEFPAYIAIANPMNGESYTEADVDLYDTILYYLMGSTASSSIPATTYTDRLATGEHTYAFGEGAGATFINNPDAVLENPDEEVPVVMIFHGMNGDPIEMVESTGWVQKAVEEKLILVAPVSTDVEYIASLLSYVKSQYSVDDSRVYATGFSMGGMTTSNVAKTYPELFAAITPMGSCGGSYVETMDEDSYDMPICMITGTADPLNCSADENGNPKFSGMSTEAIVQAFTMNEIEVGEADYSIGPWGYEPDNFIEYTIKDISYEVNQFYTDKYSVPIVQAVTELGVLGGKERDHGGYLRDNILAQRGL